MWHIQHFIFCMRRLLKVLTGSCKRNLQPTKEQTTNTLSVTMNVSKLCMVVFISYMFSISLYSVSAKFVVWTHMLHLKELPRFKSSSLSRTSLYQHKGAEDLTPDWLTQRLLCSLSSSCPSPLLSSQISFSLLHISL